MWLQFGESRCNIHDRKDLLKAHDIIHRIHNGAQNHQAAAGQASSFKFCKFASF